uniref:uncharacterized protein LOC100182578 isoform X2 n=1 Tax=Ciona intestinalis TaxID=7719 RepID=UPI000EF448AD|nr:uncharacterized protein LOC100182578 isoform X2 [Ciona intestinalis]|eukprot:XP_026695517.1 uncharacterized protein LOC100182578 isoform X2 [Ciona intestinalis]
MYIIREEILSWNDSKKNVTGSNNFHISPNKNPIYLLFGSIHKTPPKFLKHLQCLFLPKSNGTMFGCLHIKVSSKTGDFDFGLSSSRESVDSSWFTWIMSIGQIFKTKVSSSSVTKENCVSPYNAIFLTIKTNEQNQTFDVETHLKCKKLNFCLICFYNCLCILLGAYIRIILYYLCT